MEMTGLWGGFYRLSEKIMGLVILNLLWIMFTLVGLIFLGLFPATIATFTVIRKWIQKEKDIPIFQTFFSAYKKDFLKGNVIAVILALIFYILYIDLQYLSVINATFYPVMLGVLVLAAAIFVVLTLYIIPVYVHFDLKLVQQFKYAILIGFTNLHVTIPLVAILAGLYYFFMKVPGFGPFFGVSVPAFVVMWFANLSFTILKVKKEKMTQSNENTIQS